MKLTSAYANKLIKKLTEDKDYWHKKEQENSVYISAVDEIPIVPDYNFTKVTAKINEIDEKIGKIKHALNLANCTNEIEVGDERYTIDELLVRMSQLNQRKTFLDGLRKHEPRERVSSSLWSSRKPVPEYRCINYDLDDVNTEYGRVDSEISAIQLALDKYNQTFEFDVDIEL